MRLLGVKVKENPFYASYEDDCWILLAQEIMYSYASAYTYQSPSTAYSQMEYDKLNNTTYAPIRKSILRKVKNGPLRNVVNLEAVYAAFEECRKENLIRMGIKWNDDWKLDVREL